VDFLGQLKPGGFVATSAAPELPYQLLRRGNGYEVRRYPSFSAVRIKYDRRDEGFGTLGAFTKGKSYRIYTQNARPIVPYVYTHIQRRTVGMNPLSPAIMQVQNSSDKFMLWPCHLQLRDKIVLFYRKKQSKSLVVEIGAASVRLSQCLIK
jgi:hypothetical protein